MSSLRRNSGEMYAVPQPKRTRSTYAPTLSIIPSASRAESPGSMTCVIPRARGLGGRAGRSRKSGEGTPGNLTAARDAAPPRERGRRLALDLDRHGGERALRPLRAQQAEDVDVVVAVAVAVPVAQHALVAEAGREQRLRRLRVRRVRVGAEAVEAEHVEDEPGDDRLRLAVGAGPPEAAGEPGADDAAPVARGELREAGDAGRAALTVDDEQVELLAALAPGGGRIDVLQRLLDARVRAPREPPRHVRVARQLE